MKKVLLGSIFAIATTGVLETSITNATSKKTLEDIVMDQQMTIESLQSQLSDVSKKLSNLEGTSSSIEEKVNTLEKIDQIDEASIQKYIYQIPQLLSDGIFQTMYKDVNCVGQSSSPLYADQCKPPIQKEALQVSIGSSKYDILKYIAEDKIKETALNAYNENKSKYGFFGSNISYQKIVVIVNEPFEAQSILKFHYLDLIIKLSENALYTCVLTRVLIHNFGINKQASVHLFF